MFTISASRVIHAPAQAVYDVIADYRVAHPAVLPESFFESMTVEEGGYGAGTVVLLKGKAFGKVQTMRQRVTEPEPGRVIKEADVDSTQYTTFTFDPLGEAQTRLTIYSSFPVKPGIRGWVERLLVPMLLRPVYNEELDNIAAYVAKPRQQTSS